MTFKEYQKESRKTAIYPDKDNNFIYPTLGLAGEVGEVVEKVKKLIRDRNNKVDDEFKAGLEKELGDVLWYIAQVCTEFGISMEETAKTNIEKLKSRHERNKLHGDSDNR